MDDICARAVREAFFRLFKAGLIYRGKRLVNWDPATGTALADDEVEMREVEGRMWYMRYPLEERHEGTEARRHEGDIDYVTVATTRPETMLGDTAVAVNPKDPRAAKLVGRSVRLPIVNRVVPIIADDYVVMPGDPDNPMAEYATGFLKVTPAHDPNDWEIGLRHEDAIPYGPINVLAPDATISRDHGWPAEEFETGQAAAADALLGLSREKARDWVVEWFDQNGLLEEVRPYHHAVGHSYRSHVPIEPYLSDQWYVKVTDDRMVGEAQRALNREQFDGKPPKREASPAKTDGDGELTFFPARYAKTYQAWHAGLRDWCISRQLWWGHRMPVWYHESALETQDAPRPNSHTPRPAQLQALPEGVAQREYGSVNYVCIKDPEGEHEDFVKQLEAAGYVRDPDVLDTWFSSGLWPISTMGWPRPQDSPETAGLLEIFNPSTVLVTARDIITLWVSRMVMFNRHLRDGKLPFRHAYINPVLQDGHGQMMSKSLGNGVDPRDIIHSHGADALRFVLCQIATSTQDIRMPVDMVCPHCSHGFHPQEATSPAGYRVAAPEQQCPNSRCGRNMTSAYGEYAGVAGPTSEAPLARNTSPKFDLGRNFANKLWNAARFALRNLEGEGEPAPKHRGEEGSVSLVDRWILTRLHHAARTVEAAVAEYQFNVYAEAMYDLVWRDFCDWYLEAIKPTVKDDTTQKQVLRTVLNAILRMLHPLCPFVTEALWPHVQATGEAGLDGVRLAPSERLAAAAWPEVPASVADEQAVATFERLQALTVAIRQTRAEHHVPPTKRIRLLATPKAQALIDAGGVTVQTLAGLAAVEPLPEDGQSAPADGVALRFEGDQLLVAGFAGVVDRSAEENRLRKQLSQLNKQQEVLVRRLDQPEYLEKAPPKLVEDTRHQLERINVDIAATREALESIEGSD
jgi:valyl-tRNA synthetase